MHLILIQISFLITIFFNVPKEQYNLDEEICLSPEEKFLYEAINNYRKQKRLPAIPISASLSKVSQLHAKDLMENFDMEQIKKCNPHSWSDQGAWTACCYTDDHQNPKCMWEKPKEISGYESPGYEIVYWNSGTPNASKALEGWKKSPGHNQVMINSDMWKKVTWNAVGVGIYGNYAVAWFGEKEDGKGAPGICE
ncbi:hypothetical protein BH23BAC1_BH23BAC1_22370 [soil metagenome]